MFISKKKKLKPFFYETLKLKIKFGLLLQNKRPIRKEYK
jgi:hypothetical protein